MTTRTHKASTPVVIVARVTFKAPEKAGWTVYIVRSSDGATTYQTMLVDGHATGCTCPARKPCKHMVACEVAEAAKQLAAKPVVKLSDYRKAATLGSDQGFSLLKPARKGA
jgi:hypothetical protein